jgi:hypothetical protein
VHRWVLAKSAITVVQLWAGIFLLSGALTTAAATGDPPWALIAGTAVMASAIAVQAWLSIVKPGPRTRWRHRAGDRPPGETATAPGWVFVLGPTAPVADLALTVLWGFPSPFVQVLTLVAVVVARRAAVRRPAARAVAA